MISKAGKYFTSSDPQHDISTNCFHAMMKRCEKHVASCCHGRGFVVFDFASGSSGLAGLLFLVGLQLASRSATL